MNKLLKNILYALALLKTFIQMYMVILLICIVPSGFTLLLLGAINKSIPDTVASKTLFVVLLVSFIFTIPLYIYTLYKSKDDIKTIIKK